MEKNTGPLRQGSKKKRKNGNGYQLQEDRKYGLQQEKKAEDAKYELLMLTSNKYRSLNSQGVI